MIQKMLQKGASWELIEKFTGITQDQEGLSQTPEQVAQSMIDGCIGQENPPVRMRTSDWSNNFCRLKTESDPTGKLIQEEIHQMFF